MRTKNLGSLIVLVLSFSVFLAGLANAAVYYVSPSGNDANAGTEASPWRTIAKINGRGFSGGDQILFQRGGVWREQLTVPSSGSSGAPILFGAYGSGNKPIINGANAISGWTASGTNIYYATVSTQPARVFFNGTPGTRKSSSGSLTSDRDWAWSSNNMLYIYSTSAPSARTIEVPQRAYGILAAGKNYLQFRDLDIRYANSDGIIFSNRCTSITIDNVTSSYSYYAGMKTTANSSANSNFTIRNSTVDHNGASGMLLSSLANSLLQSNVATYNSMLTDSDEQFTYAGGIRITGTESVGNIIEKNECSYQQHGTGIWVDFNGPGNIVRHNRTHHNNQIGIFNEITSGTEIYGNVSHDNSGWTYSAGIWVEGRAGTAPYNGPAANNKVYNNTIYRNGTFGLVLQNGADGVQGYCHDNEIKNNIIFGTTSGPNLRVGGKAENEYNLFDRNCLGPDKTNFVEWGWGSYRSSYSAWESSYGRATNSIKADPQLNNPASNDYSLQPASPALNAGLYLGDRYKLGLGTASVWPASVVIVDRGTGNWDLGGYENSGSPTSTCTYSISPTSNSFQSGAGTGSINVTTQSNCSWNATSSASWLTIASGSSGTGSGTVNYSVSQNASAARTGTVTAGGQTFSISQAAGTNPTPTCTYSISPTSNSFQSGAGTGSINMTTQSGCSWNATSSASWLTIASASSGTGSGTVNYSVSQNASAARTGTITVGGQTFSISQAAGTNPAPTCTYSISPTSNSFQSGAGTGSIRVTAQSGCSWTATSSASWLTIAWGGRGSGSGNFGYRASQNTTPYRRTATIMVGGKTFTLTQAARGW